MAFWAAAASAIDWFKHPGRRCWHPRTPGSTAGSSGRCATPPWNCLDRHVAAGHGERRALIYNSPVTGTKRVYNYRALLDEVEIFAAVLADLGIRSGRGRPDDAEIGENGGKDLDLVEQRAVVVDPLGAGDR